MFFINCALLNSFKAYTVFNGKTYVQEFSAQGGPFMDRR